MNAEGLLLHFERVGDAPDAVDRLRRFILDLATRGKLVEQDPNDEPASQLLKRVTLERTRKAKAGEVRKPPTLTTISDDETLHALPSSWAWARVGEIFDYDAGTKRDPKALNQSRWLLELEDIEKDTSRVVQRFRVSDREPLSTKSEFEPGDILYGKLRPYLNKVVVADEAGYSTTEIVVIRPFEKLCPGYCALAFRRSDFVAYVERLGRGTKMPRLRTPDAIVAPFPLPPLAEQHRIVAKVDELMGLCDRLEAARAGREGLRDRLATASFARLYTPDRETFQADACFALDALPALTSRPDQIRALRQTILNLAVRGKLVPQHATDEPAAIGERQRFFEENEIPFAAPEGWRWFEFGDLAKFENGDRGKNYPNRDEYVANGVAWINTGHIQPDGSLSLASMNFITRAKFETLGGGKIRPGDLLYCLRGATFGKTAFVEPFTEGAIASSLMIIRPGDILDRRFAYLYLISPAARSQLLRFDNGTAQPNLSSGNVKKYMIAVPPLAEQHRIIAKVDDLMALCDRLDSSLAATAATRRRLLDALLNEALDRMPLAEAA